MTKPNWWQPGEPATAYTLSERAGITVTELYAQLTCAETEIARLRLMVSHSVNMRLSLEQLLREQAEEIESLRLALRYDAIRRHWRSG